MYSENRREYEKKVMQIVEERWVSDFIPVFYFVIAHGISLKPCQVGTILNDIFFLIFIKINEKREQYFLSIAILSASFRLIQNSRIIKKFAVFGFWSLV